jgi:replicative DNA helicase
MNTEHAVLGSILLDPEMIQEVCEILTPEDFAQVPARATYEAMLKLHSEDKGVDLMLLAHELRAEGFVKSGYIAGLCDTVATGIHAKHHAENVKADSVRRNLARVGKSIQDAAEDVNSNAAEAISRASQELSSLLDTQTTGPETRSLRQGLDTVADKIEHQVETGAGNTGLTTGFSDLDDLTTGFHGGELIIVAGRTSMGKSTLALNMMRRSAPTGPCLLFSLEMSEENIVTNILTAESHVDSQCIRKAEFTPQNLEKIFRGCSLLSELPIFIHDEGGLNIDKLCMISRRMKHRHGIKYVYVDYLQLVTVSSAKGRSREQDVAEVSGKLKALAKNLNVPVVALSQLKRPPAGKTDVRPQLSDLRESGAIEQDADAVMFIHRPDYYDPGHEKRGIAEIIVAKQRNGPPDTVDLRFIGNNFRFEDCVKRENWQ